MATDPPPGGAAIRRAAVAAALCAVPFLAACGSSAHGAANAGRIAVVAGENVWGSIAQRLGGPAVAVTSLVTSPNEDPHLYTANAADAAAVANARLVVQNGAGYDDFVAQLLAASGRSPTVVDVATVLGTSGPNPNPHFWYSERDVERVAAAITAAYERLDPGHSAAYEARHRAFVAWLAPLRGRLAELAARDAGAPVAYTERVPGYLVAAAGLRDRTPAGFARAVEAGSEPSVVDVVSMQQLLARHLVRALLYNTQTVSAVTTQVRDDARAAHVPVVEVTETMPRGEDYRSWQLSQVDALLAALGEWR